MVVAITSYDVDLFNSAYVNIAFIANKFWACNNDDNYYRKLNQKLWIKIAKSKEKNIVINRHSKKLVSDVIPNSRLSKYGNFHYNHERESLYMDDTRSTSIHESFVDNAESIEPWLHPNVKECFAKLKGNKYFQSNEALSGIELTNDTGFSIDEEFENYCCLPYSIDSIAELELKKRISCESVLNIWRKSNVEYCMNHGANKESGSNLDYRKRHGESVATCNLQQTVILPRGRYKEKGCKCSTKTSGPMLSAEVPEFFPKRSCLKNHCESIPAQYFANRICYRIAAPISLPSVQTTVQSADIPLMASPIITPVIRPQWLPRLASPLQIQVPVCTLAPPTFASIQPVYPVVHYPIQLHEKIIQPNQVNPSVITTYHDSSAEHIQECKEKCHRVDLTNLVLLTKTGMKSRRCLSTNSEHYNLALEESQITSKTGGQVLQWLNKEYGRPIEDFIASSFAISDLRHNSSKPE